MTPLHFFARPAPAPAIALLLSVFHGTAQADPRSPSGIPEAETKSTAASRVPEQEVASDPGSELPLPYARWEGGSLPPLRTPVARDLPAPLARPRQSPRRPLEVSAALSAFLPSCGSGSVDDRRCLTLRAGSGFDAALLYRAAPFFAFGAEAALSGFGEGTTLSTGGGRARFVGVIGRVYFADDGAWDPYVALTLGGGVLDLGGASRDRVATAGWGGRVAAGLDYLFSSHLRIGPSASFSRWIAHDDSLCEGEVCRSQPASYGHVLGFGTLGLRVTTSFGDAL